MAETPGHRSPSLEIAVAALVIAASIPLSRLFQEGALGNVAASSILISLGVAWALRRWNLPTIVSMGISALILVWYSTIAFADHTLWGPFPTLESLRSLGVLVDIGARQAVEEVAPVPPTDALLFLVASGVWATAWIADGSAMRAGSPLLTIIATVPLFVVPGTVVTGTRRWLDLGAFIAASALLLFLHERARVAQWGSRVGLARPGWRAWPAARLALVVGIAAVAIAPLVPGYGSPPGLRDIGSTGSRVVFNPFIAIKPTLDRSPDRILFTVDSGTPSYYRLTALDRFDGKVWSQGRDRGERKVEGPIRPVSAADGNLLRQEIEIDALAGSWLPAAYEPVGIAGAGDVDIESESRALLLDRPLDRGLRYRVDSRVPFVTAASLDVPVNYDEDALERYLELPRRLPAAVRRIAEDVTRSESTAFAKARALQNYLRTFTYDEDVAAGHSFDTLVEFLTESKRGYCEQFAGAMAVLARAIDIPSRVVIGFAGGRRIDPNTYWVTTEFAHAWVEIYFPQAGWVAFEPTPRGSVAQVPEYALPEEQETDDPSATPSAEPTDVAETQDPTDRSDRAAEEEVETGGGASPVDTARWVIPALLALVVLLAALLALVRFLVKRRALHAARTPTEAATLRYVDFLEWCAAAGYTRATGETPREHARRLATVAEEAEEPLARVAVLAEAALWAPPNGMDPLAVERAVGEARRALSTTLSRRTRLLAALGWGSWRART